MDAVNNKTVPMSTVALQNVRVIATQPAGARPAIITSEPGLTRLPDGSPARP